MKTRTLLLALTLFVFSTGLYAQTDQDKKDLLNIAERGCTGAHVVRMKGLLEKYPELISLTDSDGNSLLLIAAKYGNLTVFNYLEQDLGFDPYSVNPKGMNALSVHIYETRISVLMPFINWLLNHYDVLRLVNTPDNDGVYPIMHAADKKYLYLIKELHEKYGAKLDVSDKKGVTLAMRLAGLGDTTSVRYLKDRGVKFSAVDDNGNNAAWYARAMGLRFQLAWEIEDYIAKEGEIIRLNGLDLEKTRVSMMLRKLVRNGDVTMLKDFVLGLRSDNNPLKGMAWTNLKYDNGESLLHIATESGHTDMVEYLYSVDPTLLVTKDDNDKTPMDRVDITTNKEVFEFLRDPFSGVKKKIMAMDISQDKKDLIFALQKYGNTLPTTDFDMLSKSFIAKILIDGMDEEADRLLFGQDEGLFETYGLYDYWMENPNSGDNYQYILMIGALVSSNKKELRRISASSIRKGYRLVLGKQYEDAVRNSSRLSKAVETYDMLIPGLPKMINAVIIGIYDKPIKIR